jgi:protein-tyrosine-phosphatase
MTDAHAQQLAALYPVARDRIHVLRSFDPDSAQDSDVADPYCGSLDDYRRCRDLIRRAVPGLVRFLNQSAPAGC